MGYTTIDCCPVDTRLYAELKPIKDATGCVYQSIYRGQDQEAQRYLTGTAPCFKHNQAWIYEHYPPGTANPPGRSTHECRSDGVAYAAPAYTPIPWWCCGIDVDDVHVQAVCNAARARGWIVTITYPGSPVEYHHVNFRKEPKVRLPTLKRGAKGPRVHRLTVKLHHLHHHVKDRAVPYIARSHWNFDQAVVNAVKEFQHVHHLTADGVVGPHTRAQLKVAWRHHKKVQD